MAKREEREETFTVTDRRLFTSDGAPRGEAAEEEISSSPVPAAGAVIADAPEPQSAEPPSPTAAEQQQQADAYQVSSQEMDRQVELGGHSAKDLEVSFERFLASLYMTGMLQLGLMQQQGAQPQLDLIGARQTIDTIGLLSDKTKGNLSAKEQTFLQNALYELRMAYVEVTNLIAKGPQQAPPAK
jgi:hypothetical protein